MKTVMAGKEFNEEQLKWLGLIREHLIANLTLDLSDFRIAPIFETRGGLGKARKLFGDELAALIEQVNFAIAA
jgi:type I restriction enzyme R subunit